ncbi:MAG: exosortase N [Leptospiraceae bacterium]|nr:exosortase N [Leptospiraceae bacterium]
MFRITALVLYVFFWILLLYFPISIYFRYEFENIGIFKFLFSYYPLLLLPFFRKSSVELVKNKLEKVDSPAPCAGQVPLDSNFLTNLVSKLSYFSFEFVIYASIYFFSVYSQGLLSLTLFATYGIGIILLRFYSIEFHFFSRLLILFCPPFTSKFDVLFGNSLRQLLTENCVSILKIINISSRNEGNLLFINNTLFTIDPECEGLKMLTSLIILIFIILVFKKENRIHSSNLELTLVFIVSILFWYFSNLVRILTLVLFKITPDKISHEWIGILLFLCIVVFPIGVYILFRYNKSYSSKEIIQNNQYKVFPILLILILILSNYAIPKAEPKTFKPFPEKVNNFVKERTSIIPLNNEITSYNNSIYRVIIKRRMDYFRVGHNPRYCFKASGYKFLYEKQLTLNSNFSYIESEIYNKDESSKLLWWYSNKEFSTGSELEWRKSSIIQNKEFIQVNIVYDKNRNLKIEEILMEVNQLLNTIE